MKNVKITYCCDYCKKVINQDSDTVLAIMPGRIGYRDQFIPEQDEEKIQHYHDYCLEHILALDYSTEFPGDKSLEALDKQEEEPEPIGFENVPQPVSEREPEPVVGNNRKVDVGKLRSLLNAGWSFKKIMEEDEFKNLHETTVRKWIKKIEQEGKAPHDQKDTV